MRKSLLTLLLLTTILFSCNNNSKTENKPPKGGIKRDTIKILGAFANAKEQAIQWGALYLVSKDTSKFAMEDSSTFKKKWVRDSLFFVPISFKDSSTGKDSTVYIPTDRALVSIERNLDSAIAHLLKVMKANPQLFPAYDTTKKQPPVK